MPLNAFTNFPTFNLQSLSKPKAKEPKKRVFVCPKIALAESRSKSSL